MKLPPLPSAGHAAPGKDWAPSASRTALAAGIAAAFAAVLYLGTIGAPFIYDDTAYVRDNVMIRTLGNLARFWTTAYPPGNEEQGLYRPVTSASYALDHALGGLSPSMFHGTNVLLHALATLLLVLLTARLGLGIAGSLAAGLVFAAHPLHTEAVAWVVGRAELLAGVFTLASLLFWTALRRGGGNRFLAPAALCYLLALGSKETAAPLPAALLLGDLLGIFTTPAGDGNGQAASRGRPALRVLLAPHVVMSAVFLLYALLRVRALGHFGMAPDSTAFAADPQSSRPATGLAVFGRYLLLDLAPWPLRVDYSDFRFPSLMAGPPLLGLAALLLVTTAAVAFRRRAPAVTFWCGWFLIFILPVANLFFPIGTILAERFTYLPSAGISALAGLALALGWRSRERRVKHLLALGGALLLGVMAVGTLLRVREWADPRRFWQSEVARSPRSEKAYHALASLLWEEGRKTGDRQAWAEAESLLRRGIALADLPDQRLTDDHAALLYGYANILQLQGRVLESLPYYGKLLSLAERHPTVREKFGADLYDWYALALEKSGDREGALRFRMHAARTRGDVP